MKTKTHIPAGLTASEIAKKYNLPRTTAWRAVKRGWFYGPDYHRLDSEPVKKSVQNRFIQIAENPILCARQLRQFQDQKLIDVKSGKSTLRENDLISFREEMTEIRNLLRKFTHAVTQDNQRKSLKAIMEEPRIHHYVLFQNKKMIDRIQSDYDAYDDEIQEAKIQVAKLYADLKI